MVNSSQAASGSSGSIDQLAPPNDSPIQALPLEKLVDIFSFLTEPRDLLNAGSVCRSWCRVATDYALWKPLVLRRWPHLAATSQEEAARSGNRYYDFFATQIRALRNCAPEKKFKCLTVTLPAHCNLLQVHAGMVLVLTRNGSLLHVDACSGRIAQRQQLRLKGIGECSVVGMTAYSDHYDLVLNMKSGRSPDRLTPNALVRINPATGRPIKTYTIDANSKVVSLCQSGAWVRNHPEGGRSTLERIDFHSSEEATQMGGDFPATRAYITEDIAFFQKPDQSLDIYTLPDGLLKCTIRCKGKLLKVSDGVVYSVTPGRCVHCWCARTGKHLGDLLVNGSTDPDLRVRCRDLALWGELIFLKTDRVYYINRYGMEVDREGERPTRFACKGGSVLIYNRNTFQQVKKIDFEFPIANMLPGNGMLCVQLKNSCGLPKNQLQIFQLGEDPVRKSTCTVQ